jgi:hypothetical protein
MIYLGDINMNTILGFFDGIEDYIKKVEEQTKICSVCNTKLPIWNFSNASGGNYLRSECKECNKKLRNARDRARKMAPKIPNNYVCPICERTEEQVKNRGGKKLGPWCCDHDHETGDYRGYLCHDCNRGIGILNDDPNRLRKAAKYIEDAKNIRQYT